jgi:hypothetical protein
MTAAGAPYDGPALRLGGGRLLLGPAGTLHVARALELAVRTARRDGIGLSPEVAQLLDAVQAEAAEVLSARGRADVRDEQLLPASAVGEIDTTEAARMIGITPRGVRHAAGRGELGRKRGGRWVLDRAEVAAYVMRNERRPA